MTANDWRELPAGRDLDALVAARVMGLRWRVVGKSRPVYHSFSNRRKGWESYTEHEVYDEAAKEWRYMPWYCEQIAAAWLVRERLRAAGWLLYLHEEGGKSQQWVAYFAEDAHAPDDSGEELGATAPLAICFAALATMDLLGEWEADNAAASDAIRNARGGGAAGA